MLNLSRVTLGRGSNKPERRHRGPPLLLWTAGRCLVRFLEAGRQQWRPSTRQPPLSSSADLALRKKCFASRRLPNWWQWPLRTVPRSYSPKYLLSMVRRFSLKPIRIADFLSTLPRSTFAGKEFSMRSASGKDKMIHPAFSLPARRTQLYIFHIGKQHVSTP